MAAQDEGKIKHYVLVDTTPQLIASEEFPHALPGEAAQQLGGLMADDFAQGCAAFCGMVAPEDETVARQLTEIASSTDVGVAMTAFGTSGGRSQLEQLAQINTPTTIICGRNDAICMPAASEVMAEAIPGCTTGVQWVEDAGHAPFLTRPDKFNEVLRAFV